MNINQINMMNMNPMMMNMNPMNMVMGNINNMNQKIKKEITVNVKLENNVIITVKCFEDDMASKLKMKCNINKGYISLNYKVIDEGLTIKENGIIDYSEIDQGFNCFNINFKTFQGQSNIIALDGNCPVGISIIHYFIKINNISEIIKVFNKKICFSFNINQLIIYDSTPIKENFKELRNPKFLVEEKGNLLGV